MGAEVQTSQEVTLLVWNLHTSVRCLVCGPGSFTTRLATQRQEVADFLPLLRSSMTTLRSSC